MIEILKLQKVYSQSFALTIENLKINKGELIGLVGNNGAGKTTLLSLILDLIKATDGHVKSKDLQVDKTDDWKNYTGSYLNERFLIPYLTPLEFFEFVGNLYGKNKSDISIFMKENEDFFSIEDKDLYIRELSAGNKNKVGILATMISNPEIIILDEPFANLDPSSQLWLKSKLKDLNAKGTTIIISSHDLMHVTEICSRILILENGKIVNDSKTHSNSLQELESYFKLN
ncbi:MAG TPA: ABC transporter ATP-binding protein [Tenuifilaceae bacterium]|nr:ABC transporter ATP-binding protein [Tenuifilaceae bacterium]HOZ14902.1 ABC transporter ATP-binding protein [Tenuifilaceae bacterium]HPI44626.1 ABC transporter ATP-binding protein [Tenuifilaceae bacterium]HPN20285.1 ABC transporter ATP-binding protein [Tenuifilaceae bacterium]HPV55999.1 ABC transporter ATP-binding protein [Tenuifilaceae bacterium]